MRKIFTEDLPKTGRRGINWKECKDRKVYFIYESINGYFIIREYDSTNTRHPSVLVEYNKQLKWMLVDNIRYFQFIPIKEKNIVDKPVEYKYQIGENLHDEKRNIRIINRYIKYGNPNKKNQTARIRFYDIECLKCGFIHKGIKEYGIAKGNGCPVCNICPKVIVEGINDIPTTEPWMIPYFQGGIEEAKQYTRSSHKKIDPICPECGNRLHKKVRISSIYTTKKISCPRCQDGISFPNKIIFNVFLQIEKEIDFFEREFYPKWCKFKFKNKDKKGLYDIYFVKDSKEYIVEMDGALGHGIKDTKELTREESKFIDAIKDKLAEQHGIHVIRIDCKNVDMDYIKNNILNSELKNIINLHHIDWDMVEKESEKNLIKQICKEYEEGLAYNEILKKYKISNVTLGKYLKKGNNLGWVKYDGIFERSKTIRNKYANPVCQFDREQNFIKIYCSQSDAQKNTGISSSTIGECCKGKRKTAGGYIWKYADEVEIAS